MGDAMNSIVISLIASIARFGVGAEPIPVNQVASGLEGASTSHAHAGLVGKWMDAVNNGLRETLTLYSNGAYKSETAMVDQKAYRHHMARNCRERKRPKKSEAQCAQEADGWVAALTSHMPEVFIGTYVVTASRIAFTHGCAEEVQTCSAGTSTESGIFFLEDNTLTIKLDGLKLKGKVLPGDASTYVRQP
jgi:hypothetical protein